VTPDDFRRLALALPGVVESAHMGTTDFRVGRIFATLGYPDARHGMVQLTPDLQAMLVAAESAAFVPVKGGWGLKGATNVVLEAINEPTLKSALEQAWRLKAGKRLVAELDAGR